MKTRYITTSDAVGTVGFGVVPGDVLVTGVYDTHVDAERRGGHVLEILQQGPRRLPAIGERVPTYHEGNTVYVLGPRCT